MWQIHALESQVSTGTRSRLQFALVLCFGLRKTVNDFGAQVNGSLDRKQKVEGRRQAKKYSAKANIQYTSQQGQKPCKQVMSRTD